MAYFNRIFRSRFTQCQRQIMLRKTVYLTGRVSLISEIGNSIFRILRDYPRRPSGRDMKLCGRVSMWRETIHALCQIVTTWSAADSKWKTLYHNSNLWQRDNSLKLLFHCSKINLMRGRRTKERLIIIAGK